MAWTNVPKPTESSVTSQTFLGGEVLGLLAAITTTSVLTSSSITSGWTDISKPTSSVWTAVAKPTSSVWTLIAKPTD